MPITMTSDNVKSVLVTNLDIVGIKDGSVYTNAGSFRAKVLGNLNSI